MGSGKYSQGGVFYGTIKGRTAFFARPKRTAPLGGDKLARAQKRNKQRFTSAESIVNRGVPHENIELVARGYDRFARSRRS